MWTAQTLNMSINFELFEQMLLKYEYCLERKNNDSITFFLCTII